MRLMYRTTLPYTRDSWPDDRRASFKRGQGQPSWPMKSMTNTCSFKRFATGHGIPAASSLPCQPHKSHEHWWVVRVCAAAASPSQIAHLLFCPHLDHLARIALGVASLEAVFAGNIPGAKQQKTKQNNTSEFMEAHAGVKTPCMCRCKQGWQIQPQPHLSLSLNTRMLVL